MRKIVLSIFTTCLVWGTSAAAQSRPQMDSNPPQPTPVATPPSSTATAPDAPVDPSISTSTSSSTTTTTTTTPVATATSTTHTTAADTTALPPEPMPRASDEPVVERRSWVNRPLLVTSSILLVGSYVPMAAIAYTSDRPSDQTNLYYPVVGPWMNLADRQCDVRNCNHEGVNKAMLILDGVGQGLGALGVVTSLFIPEKTTSNWYLVGNDKAHGGPTRVGTGYGIGAAGVF